jgi:hypothetical protein
LGTAAESTAVIVVAVHGGTRMIVPGDAAMIPLVLSKVPRPLMTQQTENPIAAGDCSGERPISQIAKSSSRTKRELKQSSRLGCAKCIFSG